MLGKPQSAQGAGHPAAVPSVLGLGAEWRWPYLHPGFREVDPGSQLVADMDVRVVGEVEDLLQLPELLCGEGGAHPPSALPLFCTRQGQGRSVDLVPVPWGGCCAVMF